VRGYVISFTCGLCRAPDREGGVVVAVHGEEINPQTPQRSVQERRQEPIEHGHTRSYSPTTRCPPPGEVTFVLLSPSVPPATSRFPPPAGQRFHCTAVVPMGKINSSDDFFTFLAHTDAGPPCWLPLLAFLSLRKR